MLSHFDRLKKSLSKTKENLFGKISNVLSHRKIDEDLIDEIEEILIEADVGVKATMHLIEYLRERAKELKLSEAEELNNLLQEEISRILTRKYDLPTTAENQLEVWLITGVNGVGKTTTIGKLAMKFASENKRVVIGACDTFRAAAIDQVAVWAERSNVDIVRASDGADPASVAFDAATAAKARNADILLIDTAGRLHTKANLMEELKKIKRVVEKAAPDANILSKLILDGTTGQNALSQVKVFTDAVGCDGLIITKLDGTAKGGVIIAIAEELEVPVEFIGIGEKIDDLQTFEPQEFVKALFS